MIVPGIIAIYSEDIQTIINNMLKAGGVSGGESRAWS